MFDNVQNQKLTQYYLDKLQEEASEVIQAVSKLRRFGPHSQHPLRTTTNHQEFVTELEDFLALVAALEQTQYCDLTLSRDNILQKTQQLLAARDISKSIPR